MIPLPGQNGAIVTARSVTPSINLVSLVEHLCKALDPDTGTRGLPYLEMQGSKLCINTYIPLRRLLASPDFRVALAPSDPTGEQSGFVRNLVGAKKNMQVHVGGRLLHATEKSTSKAIEKLQSIVADRVDAALSSTDICSLAFKSTEAGLNAFVATLNLAQKGKRAPMKFVMPKIPTEAKMVPITFVSSECRGPDTSRDVARVLTAIETIDGRDTLDLLLKGIENKLRKSDRNSHEIEEVLDCIRSQRNRPGSLIREFLDFLQDSALARVRLQVSMRIMEAVAVQSFSPGFKEYVYRVKQCYETFGGPNGDALILDASSALGQSSVSDFAEHLRKALFYKCLSVWPSGDAQIFEVKPNPDQGIQSVREVTYRFRVNGDNPLAERSSGGAPMPAFNARIAQLRENLTSAASTIDFARNAKRDLAELLFLHLVTPDSMNASDAADMLARAQRFASDLSANPMDTINATLNSLESRCGVVANLSRELIKILKNRAKRVVSMARQKSDKFRVSLHKNIINWEAIDSITPNTDILVKAQSGDNATAWFSHLTISQDEVVPGSLASFLVETDLQERILVEAGSRYTSIMKRDLSAPMLPVRFVPVRRENLGIVTDLDDDDSRLFDTGIGVDLQYHMHHLGFNTEKEDKDLDKSRREHLRAASVTAFTLLAYVTLYEVQKRLRTHMPDAGIAMLRLQHKGRQLNQTKDYQGGSTAVYVASKAIAKALAREGFIKLQGITADEAKNDAEEGYRQRSALHALIGGQRLQFPLHGCLDKVALVTYVTRPCDKHPAHTDADGYIFLIRTYAAQREGNSGNATLQQLYMRSRLVESRKDFKNPQPVLDEIDRLQAQGFKHVLLLSQHFGNRHIGRASERHAPHGTLEFLDEAVKRFPDVHLYTLRRDVFPATRMRDRDSGESGFEVMNFKDHQEMYASFGNEVMRSVVPIYTFATMTVVGKNPDGRPQSGFCAYFFDVEQRLADVQMREMVRQNMLGIGNDATEVNRSLTSVLRAIHFMECEVSLTKNHLIPVLDPYGWINPERNANAGELEIIRSRRSASVLLSLPAVLAHVTKVLHKEDGDAP